MTEPLNIYHGYDLFSTCLNTPLNVKCCNKKRTTAKLFASTSKPKMFHWRGITVELEWLLISTKYAHKHSEKEHPFNIFVTVALLLSWKFDKQRGALNNGKLFNISEQNINLAYLKNENRLYFDGGCFVWTESHHWMMGGRASAFFDKIQINRLLTQPHYRLYADSVDREQKYLCLCPHEIV